MSSRRTEKKERILYGEEGGVVKSAMKLMGTMEMMIMCNFPRGARRLEFNALSLELQV